MESNRLSFHSPVTHPFSKDDLTARRRVVVVDAVATHYRAVAIVSTTHMTAPMLRLELSLLIIALRRTILVLVPSQQGEEACEASTDGSFKRTTVVLGRRTGEYSLGDGPNSIFCTKIGRCSPSNIPGATQVYQTSGR